MRVEAAMGSVKENGTIMRISTPVDKKSLKHHFDYHGWKYLLLAVFAVFGWWLIYDMTEPQAPADKRIDIYVQSESTADELMRSFMGKVWQEAVPEMEEVNPYMMLVSDEYNATMMLMVHIAAADGDIYLMDESYFRRYAADNIFVPLEGLIEEGRLNVNDIDLEKGYVDCVAGYDEEHNPNAWERHLCGIPLEGLYGFMTEMQVDNRKLYACIAVNNGNEENVIRFFDAMIQQGRGEKPDWMQE